MKQTDIPCPGADEKHLHNLVIASEETGNLICAFSLSDYTCPFIYRDRHKVDWWQAGYNPALGKFEK